MSPLYTVAWCIWLLLSVTICLEATGFRGLARTLPEDRRWWHLPLQLAALVLFALVVLNHPFR